MKRWMVWFVAAGAVLLAGCAGPRIVDSDVNAYSTLTAVPSVPTFRFERLPSQQLGGEPQARLEGLATAALNKVGLRRDDVAARYSVLIGLRVQRFERGPWDDPFWPGGGFGRFGGFGGPDYVVTAGGQVVFLPSFPRTPGMPWYEREVSLVLRDLATQQVVYETAARHDGRWHDTAAVLPAMLDAALQGFPTPPQGARRVDIEIPR